MMARMSNLPATREGNDPPLTPEQEFGAEMAATGLQGAALARECGVTIATVKRWEKLPAFQEHRRLHAARWFDVANTTALQTVITKWKAQGKAVDKLVQLLEATDDEGRPLRTVQLEAAQALTRMAMKETLAEMATAAAKANAEDKAAGRAPSAIGALHIHFRDDGGITETVDGEVVDP